MTENDDLIKELIIIKRLLVAQMILAGVSFRDLKKITGMGTDTLHKFIPKNFGKKSE